MAQRRTRIADAAIDVLADGGGRALTHRAVDSRAGLPVGSTSNCFRTREALLIGVIQRLLEREHAMLLTSGPPTNPGALVDELVRVVEWAAGPHRNVALARQAVFAEAASLPGVRDEIDRARDRFAEWMAPALLEGGSTDVATHHRVLLALVDGLITRRLVAPGERLDPAIAVGAAVRGLLGPPGSSRARCSNSATASSGASDAVAPRSTGAPPSNPTIGSDDSGPARARRPVESFPSGEVDPGSSTDA